MSVPVSEEQPSELVKLLSDYLLKKETNKALELVQPEEVTQSIKDSSWDIVRVVSEYLTQEIYVKKNHVYDCCEIILEKVANVAVAEEALLEFLEQAESLNNDVKFLAMLKPLQIVLLRLTKRKEQSLGWCLSTIKTHFKSLPSPQEYNLEENERLLLDADPTVQRITNMYYRMMYFYRPFVDEVSLKVCKKTEYDEESVKKQRQLLICFLLHLLEKPLVFLDLEWDKESVKSLARDSAEEMVYCLKLLLGDLLAFLDYNGPVEDNESSYSNEDDINFGGTTCMDSFIKEDRVPIMSLSVLYYLVFAEDVLLEEIPFVYDPVYLLRCSLHHSSVLLKNTEVMILRKGLLLSQAMLKRFSDFRIASNELDFTVYSKFVNVLAYVMVYCGVEECRKLAGIIFKSFMFKFDTKGRYLLMCNLQKTINHSGTLGYIITLLKDMIFQAFSEVELPSYFSGKCLNDLVTGYCRLPHGAESDLVELADEIISALNLIRFLLMHDRTNKTQVWDYVQTFEESYLVPLREGLKLSRAHYQLKLKELGEEKMSARMQYGHKSEVTITVGCQQLPDVPYDQKVFLINSALNAFDLMECLMSHINECIEAKPIN